MNTPAPASASASASSSASSGDAPTSARPRTCVYEFDQTPEQGTITFRVAHGTRKSDVQVRAEGRQLCVGVRGHAPVVVGALMADVEDSLWQLEGTTVTVHFDKVQPRVWPMLVGDADASGRVNVLSAFHIGVFCAEQLKAMDEARTWFDRAATAALDVARDAEHYDGATCTALAQMLLNCSDMHAAQHARRRSFELLDAAADLGSTNAQMRAAIIYLQAAEDDQGGGVNDNNKATTSSSSSSPSSLSSSMVSAYTSLTGDAARTRGMLLLERAAENNVVHAQVRLGEMHEQRGEHDAALRWYERAVALGNRSIAARLGSLQLRVGQRTAGLSTLRRALESDSAAAAFALAADTLEQHDDEAGEREARSLLELASRMKPPLTPPPELQRSLEQREANRAATLRAQQSAKQVAMLGVGVLALVGLVALARRTQSNQ